MKMKPIFHLDMSRYPKGEPKAMLEMVGGRLLANLKERYPSKNGFAIHRAIRAGASPFTTHWDFYLSRGHFWKFKLSLEISQANKKVSFHISMGRNLDHNVAYMLVGQVISLISLVIAFIDLSKTFNSDIILPVLIGALIGGFTLLIPIRWILRPYIIRKARDKGIEEAEAYLLEEITVLLKRAGLRAC
ncbi:MAG: hypothetical protein Q9M08_07095 [Mariprofundus sp.]|nr:hypothetical protein [Mariprofundus sp.]